MQDLCIEFVRFVKTCLVLSKNLIIKKTCVCNNNFEKINCSKKLFFCYRASILTVRDQHDNWGGGIRILFFKFA